ncbi:MAG: transposase, partial [Paludibacteraceae bacterium]|nr:transposase [Paludibacteraceae bacterium]
MLNKYEYHLPLYRQVQQYNHLGFKVNESTIAGWIKPTAELLKPLYNELVSGIFKSHYIQCDE